jgi:signal transduction histidine kinase
MNTALRNPIPALDVSARLRSVRVMRFALPLFLFVLATGFEVWEHWLEGEAFFVDHLGLLEVLIFGILGPFAIYLTLTYVLQLLTELEQARADTTAINLNLEQRVVERTTALQASNAELEQANLRLREMDRMKSDFVALVSHELRAPLATLNGGLEVALQDEATLPAKAQRILRLLAGETQRLTQFVQTLLDVSQVEAGKLQFTCGLVAVRPMLKRAVAVVFGAEEARVVWQLPSDLPPIWADETYAEQAIRNLLRNAQKYAPPNSAVELSATVQDGALQIGVTDHGPGIPLAEQSHIFERFYRLHNRSERKARGWGLGLYFARVLVEAQGGTLTLQSPIYPDPEAPGSCFTVTLPIAEEEPENG